jgi:hypothetical protein
MSAIEQSEYAFGVIGGEPSRPERDWDKERKADRITRSELLKRQRWSPDDFDVVKGHGFPDPIGYEIGGYLNPKREPIYSLKGIEAWFEKSRAFAKLLQVM